MSDDNDFESLKRLIHQGAYSEAKTFFIQAMDRYRKALKEIAEHPPTNNPAVNSYGELSGSRDCHGCAYKILIAKAGLRDAAE